MHILWLANDVITQGPTPSTTPLASALMDAVAPHCVLPLQSWPEEMDTSSVTGRHFLEL